ncbi:hypothetical protein B0T26DRAFT_749375 [Lasiosphaeria miniovina]|uniref:AAA+ ATPase domain-containing protein n=1 Tax=Lasiosphaeria miniovina TaxID=1954250 RepID=A0AA40E1W3_9PEZI|nr:uncharacterized protein B0T26DRAFT_749375 [Lasiosphaeria miniovina]KAK0721912.1 hypothetical protein B0T26DRAFT_749375 [Lasiosphaeria miniovina]
MSAILNGNSGSPSNLEERVRLLEEKVAGAESGGGYGIARHNSLGDQGSVTDSTDFQHPTQLTNKDTIPEVRRCNFMQFKNRFTDEDGRYAIDVLLSGALLQQEMHEEQQFRKHRSGSATVSSRSGKAKDAALKARNILNAKAVETAQSDDVWMRRVRIQSPAILKILSNIQGESWSSRPRTYLRPFITIISFQAEMKGALRDLESRWGRHLDGAATPASFITNAHSPAPTDGGVEESEESVDNCPEALAAMRCYVKFVDENIIPEYTQWDGLKASDDPKVRFSDLHYLFRTGELVYRPYGTDTSGKGNPQDWKRTGKRLWRCYGLRSRDMDYRVCHSDHRKYDVRHDSGEQDASFIVRVYYLEYTGEEFCTVVTKFAIQPFKGLRRIRSLPVYPLRFGPTELDKYLADAAELGDKTLENIDIKHVSYDSWTVTRTPKGDATCDANGVEMKHPEYINSDVMVDFNESFQACPHWKPKRGILKPEPVKQLVDVEVVPVRTGVSKWEQNKFVSTDPLLSQMSENLARGQLTTRDYLSPIDKGLIACRVFGYVFQDRKFAQMDIQHISVQGHLMQKADERRHGQGQESQDFIRGKGAGLFILLHGVPGVGKTATVEAIAQTHNKPLFKITCGDLSLTPEQVESSLGSIFRLANSWDCILLMDEVDTFFSQRSKGDAAMTKNALVSVFLRILDYYTGILFMTTNRVGALDEAFRSRIHYNIFYPPLSQQQAREIWEINLRRLGRIDAEHQRRTGKRPLEIPAEEILQFAEEHFTNNRGGDSAHWNGRQIRNAFQISASLRVRIRPRPLLFSQNNPLDRALPSTAPSNAPSNASSTVPSTVPSRLKLFTMHRSRSRSSTTSVAATTRSRSPGSSRQPSIFAQLRSRPISIADQVTAALNAAPVIEGSIQDLPRIVWANKRYILDSQVHKKSSRGRTS